ncbi:MAG: RsmB/NOP family class I SAM-dependent RNA methyltransferase [Prevotellaceae bacterium]|nr:RsmB/NOP family class I SAM-dependent RNA methyltransferase [Prevotellaceae bacterium]
MTLPVDFERTMTHFLGKEEYTQLAEALALPAPTSIRINKQKETISALNCQLSTLNCLLSTVNCQLSPVPWCPDGFYLSERPSFTFDPLFHAGCYYVQEASSMFLSHILKQYVNEPVTALDLCAAPGGKSTLALSELPEGSVLIANEVVRQRANILAENLIKWGNPYCIVTNNYAEDFGAFSDVFDLIICDAPCSGEGMFRKDPASIGEWSLANVDTCWRRQRDIVRNIWHTLKEGGLFIYSTCTYNPLEDEENVEWIAKTLGADVLSCHPLPEWGLTETNTHFYPHRVKGEGFFVSVLRKTTTDDRQQPTGNGRHKKVKEGKKGKVTPKIPQELKRWLLENEDFVILEEGDLFRAIPTLHHALYEQVQRNLKVVHAGIELASVKGKNLQPSQSLAMSNCLNKEVFPIAEVDEQQAIAYLRTEALQLPANTPKGYVLITYQGHPLGFAKNIGNRANNLYPAEWRIRKSEK